MYWFFFCLCLVIIWALLCVVFSALWRVDAHHESHHGRHHTCPRHRRHDALLLDVWGTREGNEHCTTALMLQSSSDAVCPFIYIFIVLFILVQPASKIAEGFIHIHQLVAPCPPALQVFTLTISSLWVSVWVTFQRVTESVPKVTGL